MSAWTSFIFVLILGVGVINAFTEDVYCISMMGSVTVKKIPTSTFTATDFVTETKRTTQTVQQTVTLDALTTTLTQTTRPISTVTAQQKTGTATEIVTVVSIFQETTTQTTTYSTKVTSVTNIVSNPTVAAPPNFTGIREALGGFVAKKKVLDTKQSTTSASPKSPPSVGKDANPKQYVQEVNCLTKVRSTSTKTVKTTTPGGTVYTRRPTQTVTTVITQMAELYIVYPSDATTTETVSSITTRTDTSTSVVTTTFIDTVNVQNIIPGTDTSYLACASSNILEKANGGQLIATISPYMGGGYGIIYAGKNLSPHNCCAVCMQRPDCYGSWIERSGDPYCQLVVTPEGSDTCSAQVPGGSYFTASRITSLRFTASNGPCGLWRNRGELQ